MYLDLELLYFDFLLLYLRFCVVSKWYYVFEKVIIITSCNALGSKPLWFGEAQNWPPVTQSLDSILLCQGFSFFGEFWCFSFPLFRIWNLWNIEHWIQWIGLQKKNLWESSLQCIVGSSFLKNACQRWINAETHICCAIYSWSSLAWCKQPKQMIGQPQKFKRWSGFLYLFSVKRLVKCNRTKPACFFRKFPSNCWFRQTIRVFYCPLCAPMYLYVIV